MIQEHQLNWLKLTLAPGLGPVSIQKLLQSFGTPEAILSASETLLAKTTGLAPGLCHALKATDNNRLEQSLLWLEASTDNHLLCLDDPQYPVLLQTIYDAPPVLFISGKTTLLNQPQLAIVGSRNPSSNGYETAYDFAQFLTHTGLVITSGLALGIDGASHQGALDAGGQTIAVTGNGLDQIYPSRHQDLAHQIVKHGALVTEFPPGTKPLPGNFPRRNRIIAGLSLGTLVAEATRKSGSLITAYKALEQSREVFAIPGSIHNPLVKGCHQLIRQGAKLVETAQDILEELPSTTQTSFKLDRPLTRSAKTCTKTDQSHQIILDAIAYDPVNIDTLVIRTSMASNIISSILLILELEGKIVSLPGGYYTRSHQVE